MDQWWKDPSGSLTRTKTKYCLGSRTAAESPSLHYAPALL